MTTKLPTLKDFFLKVDTVIAKVTEGMGYDDFADAPWHDLYDDTDGNPTELEIIETLANRTRPTSKCRLTSFTVPPSAKPLRLKCHKSPLESLRGRYCHLGAPPPPWAPPPDSTGALWRPIGLIRNWTSSSFRMGPSFFPMALTKRTPMIAVGRS